MILMMVMVDGNSQQARSATEFGNSWVAYPDQCDGVDPGPTDPCEDGVNSLSASNDLCYYLKDPSGKNETHLKQLSLSVVFLPF